MSCAADLSLIGFDVSFVRNGTTRHLLDGPLVSVGVGEEDHSDVVEGMCSGFGVFPQHLDSARLDAPFGEDLIGSFDVGYDQLETLH